MEVKQPLIENGNAENGPKIEAQKGGPLISQDPLKTDNSIKMVR